MMVLTRIVAAFALATGALAATSTITNVAATTSPVGPTSTATVLSDDINLSFINKQINIPELPPHVGLFCTNCSTGGTFELISGGYNSSDSDLSIAEDFFDDGYLEFAARGIHANVSLDMRIESGFSTPTFKLPLFFKHLFVLPLGDLANIDFLFEVFIPISLTLNSQVDIFSGFLLSVPDDSRIYLDIGNKSNSYITGFNETKLTPLPFDVSAPGLSFSLITGLEMQLTANSSTKGFANSSVTGDVVLTLDLPLLNTTVKEVKNVNASCDSPVGREQTFDTAVNVLWSAEVGLHLDGQFDASVANAFHKEFDPPEISAFNRTFPLPSQCFKFDPKSTGLVPANPSSVDGTTGNVVSADNSNKQTNAAGTLGLSLFTQATMALLGVATVAVAML